jgi:hypothetical protein
MLGIDVRSRHQEVFNEQSTQKSGGFYVRAVTRRD